MDTGSALAESMPNWSATTPTYSSPTCRINALLAPGGGGAGVYAPFLDLPTFIDRTVSAGRTTRPLPAPSIPSPTIRPQAHTPST